MSKARDYDAIIKTINPDPGYYDTRHSAKREDAASNKLIIAERRAKVAELSHARVPQYEIAELLHVSAATVCNDVAWLKKQWQAEALEDTAAQRERELTELAVWEAKMANEAAKATGQALLLITDRILKIKDARAKLLGLYAPTKTALTNPDGTAAYAHMSEEDLDAKIAEMLAKTGNS